MNSKRVMFGIAIAMSCGVANAQYWNVSNGNKFDAMTSSNTRSVYVGIGTAPSTSYRLNVSGSTNLQGATRVGSSLTVTGKSTLASVAASGQSTFSGNVGIGTAPLDTKILTVNGDVSMTGTISLNATNKYFTVGLTGSGGITFKNENSLNTIISEHQGKNSKLGFRASAYNFNSGDVTIAKNLDVKGKITCHNEIEVTALNADAIKAKDINVELTHAADYVFDESYKLQSLSEVESYVKSNKHLPGVPSASEIAENGMSVSQMSNLLLEKVEELTLHMIQLEKENQALKAEISNLKK